MMRRASAYSKMYLVSPGVYERLLTCIDGCDKLETESLNKPSPDMPGKIVGEEQMHTEDIIGGPVFPSPYPPSPFIPPAMPPPPHHLPLLLFQLHYLPLHHPLPHPLPQLLQIYIQTCQMWKKWRKQGPI